MKIRFSLLLALTLSLCLQSCGDDDVSTNASDLIGTWNAQSFGGNIISTNSFGGTSTTVNTSFDASDMNYTLDMTGDSYSTSGGYVLDFTTTVQGNTSMVSDTYSNVSGSGTYSVSGDEITIVGELFDLEFNGMPVTTSTGAQAATYSISNDVLTISHTVQDNTNAGGVSVTTDITTISTWTK